MPLISRLSSLYFMISTTTHFCSLRIALTMNNLLVKKWLLKQFCWMKSTFEWCKQIIIKYHGNVQGLKLPLASPHARSNCHLRKETRFGFYKTSVRKAAIHSLLRGICEEFWAKATQKGKTSERSNSFFKHLTSTQGKTSSLEDQYRLSSPGLTLCFYSRDP